ncbi:hypothetical protein [Faecalispora anaeroviscerum]|uniref:hypothetical protein n=1 Tax=Faecalispora anaeroviscerum TaxID=2991836 RepID=UPI0024BA3749|nr:hypothetical protein [Faecalispora anaeroviscerum]
MRSKLKRIASFLVATMLASSVSGGAFAQTSERTLTLDTKSYSMAPGNIYDFKAVVAGPGLAQADVKVSDSRNGSVVKLSSMGNGKYRITALKEGTTYVVADINGTHASIQVNVKKGVKQGGIAGRSVAVIPADASYASGMYKVGTDIPAGEYILVQSDPMMAYFQVSSSSDGTFESVISNDNFDGRSIITVSDGQYLNVSRAKIYSIDKAPALDKSLGYLTDGMYRVGIDIPAGEYKIRPNDSIDGYYELTEDSSHLFSSMIGNGIISNEQYLTIDDGQYLKISRAKIALK